MKKYFLTGLLFALLAGSPAAAQNILHVSGPNSALFIKAGTPVSFNGLVLTPAADLTINTATDVIKTTTITHPSSNPYISRVYQFSAPLAQFTGSIGFSYNDNELNGISESDLTLNIHDGLQWNSYLNGVNRDATANIVTTAGLSSLTLQELTLAGSMASLPVSFLSLNLLCQGNGTLVRWSTAGEAGTSRFVIESSSNGRSWTETGTVRASGTTTLQTDYTFTDPAATTSSVFYRIAEYDGNGRKTLSSVIRSSCAPGASFSVYPNPVASAALVSITAAESVRATFRLYDSRGTLVRTREAALLKGNNQLSFDASGLPPGMYSLMATWGNQRRISRLVKE